MKFSPRPGYIAGRDAHTTGEVITLSKKNKNSQNKNNRGGQNQSSQSNGSQNQTGRSGGSQN